MMVSGDHHATLVNEAWLADTLAGTVLLVEFDGCYGRIFTWLLQYRWKRRVSSFRGFKIRGSGPALFQSGDLFTIAASSNSPPIKIRESVLEERWSGRLYIAEWRKEPLLLVGYLWKDVRESLECFIHYCTGH